MKTHHSRLEKVRHVSQVRKGWSLLLEQQNKVKMHNFILIKITFFIKKKSVSYKELDFNPKFK